MTIFSMGLVIILNMVIQSTILPYWTVFGYSPNTSLICVIVIALLRGRYHGGLFGLVVGLLQDIMFGTVIGVNALIYFIIGYTLGIIQGTLNTNNKIVPILCTALSTVVYNFLYFFFMFFLARNVPISTVVRKIFSIEILYNAILTIFIYKLFSKLFKAPSLDFRRG